MGRLSESAFAAQARELQARFADDERAAGFALFELVRFLAEDAQRIRNGVSGDAYVERALGTWDRDMSRLQNQLENVMAPALAEGEPTTVAADVVAPILEGLWPAWMSELPQYRAGVRPMDPLLPPTTRAEVLDGVRRLKTRPVVTAVVQLWNGANEARGFDASSGDDAPSRAFKKTITEFRAAFEGRAPGDPDEGPSSWDGVVEWAGRLSEQAADGASDLWSSLESNLPLYVAVAAAGTTLAVLLWRSLK